MQGLLEEGAEMMKEDAQPEVRDAGLIAAAQKVIAELKARAGHEYIDETLIVYIFIALGERDQAFAWMEKGYQSRASNLPWMIMEPKFDPLRSDPRFSEFVRRMGLK